MGIEEKYEGKIVLVTGGAGCIGTNLIYLRIRHGCWSENEKIKSITAKKTREKDS